MANDLAWIMATNPDPAVRNPAEALRLARLCCASDDPPPPMYLDTLAAAYAASEQFADAVTAAEAALAQTRAADKPADEDEIVSRLELYRSRKAFVETKR